MLTIFLLISQEHPDHFDVPTLRSMPEFLKNEVTVLFQNMIDEKTCEKWIKGHSIKTESGYQGYKFLHSKNVFVMKIFIRSGLIDNQSRPSFIAS